MSLPQFDINRSNTDDAIQVSGAFAVTSRNVSNPTGRGRHQFGAQIIWKDVHYDAKQVTVIVPYAYDLDPGSAYTASGIMDGVDSNGVPIIRLRARSIALLPERTSMISKLAGSMSVQGTGVVVAMETQNLGSVNDPFVNNIITVAHKRHGNNYDAAYYCSATQFDQFLSNVHVGGRIVFQGFVDGYQYIPGRWLIRLHF